MILPIAQVVTFVFSTLCLPQLAVAHGRGLGVLGDLRAVNALQPRDTLPYKVSSREHVRTENAIMGPLSPPLIERATPRKCGALDGSCPTGYCCSVGGYCGKTYEYCSGPACQLNYGDFCDANRPPSGSSTKDVPRPKIGNITYGADGIYRCTSTNVVALTFDDGPYIYTSDLLDILDKYEAKATFFINGNNLGKGAIDNASTGYPQILKRMYDAGHQLASHTWTHQNLSNLTTQQREDQMIFNEMAFRNIFGFFPTYMRPPYSQANHGANDTMADLGYHIIYFNIDSDDYDNDSPSLIQKAKDNIDAEFATVKPDEGFPAKFIEIAHDIHEQTVHNLTAWTLERMKALGFGTSVTVGECLGDPKENWYRNASGAQADAPLSQSTLPSVTPTPIPSSKGGGGDGSVGPSGGDGTTTAQPKTGGSSAAKPNSAVADRSWNVVTGGVVGFVHLAVFGLGL